MIAVFLALFTVGLGGLIGLAVALSSRVTDIDNRLRDRDIDHAMCIAHVSHYVGNHFAAKVLQAAADDYATAEGQYEVTVIISGLNSSQREDGPPIPSLWLHKRAERLVAEVEEPE